MLNYYRLCNTTIGILVPYCLEICIGIGIGSKFSGSIGAGIVNTCLVKNTAVYYCHKW